MQRNKENDSPLLNKKQLIANLIQLGTQFKALQMALANDQVLAAEYAIHSKDPELKAKAFSPLFITSVIIPFHKLIGQYLMLKKEAITFIPSDVLDDIENSVLNAGNDEEKLQKLYYFPIYQKIHENEFNKHQQLVASKIAAMESKIEKLQTNYEGRKKAYVEIYAGAGIASIFAVGLPLLFTNAIVHLIDKIILEIRKKSLRADIACKNADLQQQRHPQSMSIRENISNNIDMLLRQSIFSVAKHRHLPSLKPLEKMDALTSTRLANSPTPG